jgi:hypothetical protein
MDADGRARKDDPDQPNTGSGTPDFADRGAYEYQPPGTIDVSADAGARPNVALAVRVHRNASVRANTLSLSLGEPRQVWLDLVDVTGRVAQVICPGVQLGPGTYQYPVAADLPTGIYFARVRTGQETLAERIVQLR